MKKVGLILLAFLILFGSLNFSVYADVIPNNKEHTKIMVRSLGEKMGIMWTNQSLDATVDYLHTKAYIEERDNHSLKQKALMLADWSEYIGNTNFTDGIATALIGPEKWYDGMKAIYEAMGEINQSEFIENYSPVGCLPNFGVNITQNYNFFVHYMNPYGDNYYELFQTDVTRDGNYFSSLDGGKIPFYVYVKRADGTIETSSGSRTSPYRVSPVNTILGFGKKQADLCQVTKTEEMIVNGDYINGDLIRTINHNGNTNITTNMPITYSNNIVYDYSQPINNPLTEDEIKKIVEEVLEENTPEPEPQPEPDDKPEGSSWWEWLIKPIASAITGLGKVLESVLGAITGLVEAIGDLLMSLVVPDSDILTEQFGSVKDTFDNKIPIINQLNDFFGQISESTINETKPTFDVNIPEEWGGGTFPIIDFTVYDQYRDWVLNFIRFIAWFVFLKRLYNRIPRIIY